MTTETTTGTPPAAPTAPTTAGNAPTTAIVTSTLTIDFPSLKWGINAGEKRALPVDAEAQKAILAVSCISIIK